MGDLFLDICFLLLAISATVFVIVKRKRFDMWISMLTCSAWILKGARYICYDIFIFRIQKMETGDILQFMQKSHHVLSGMDALVNLLLFAVLVRLIILGLYSRWYTKAKKSLDLQM